MKLLKFLKSFSQKRIFSEKFLIFEEKENSSLSENPENSPQETNQDQEKNISENLTESPNQNSDEEKENALEDSTAQKATSLENQSNLLENLTASNIIEKGKDFLNNLAETVGLSDSNQNSSEQEILELSEEEKEKIERINNALKENLPQYLNSFETELEREEFERRLNIIYNSSVLDMRGGYSYLPEGEEEKKYEFLSSIFLKKQNSPEGYTEFKVQNLDADHETKMNLGAGHLLPPSIQTVQITDNHGNSRIGTRAIRNNTVGYFDQNGYIPIYDNYILRPLEEGMISESSDQYKTFLASEIENFKKIKDSAAYFQSETEGFNRELQRYGGSPIGTLTSLTNSDETLLASRGINEVTLESIRAAKQNLNIIQVLSSYHRLPMLNNDQEIDGGLTVLNYGEEIVKTLGWSSQHKNRLSSYQQKISEIDQEKVKSEGQQTIELNSEYSLLIKFNPETENLEYFNPINQQKIGSIETYLIERTLEDIPPPPNNQTVNLLNAISNPRKNFILNGNTYSFYEENYQYFLNLKNINQISSLIEKPQELEKILQELQTGNTTIKPQEFLERISSQYYQALTLNEVREVARNIGWSAFLNPNENFTKYNGEVVENQQALDVLIRRAGRYSGQVAIDANYDRFINEQYHPDGGGRLRCGSYINYLLGLYDRGFRESEDVGLGQFAAVGANLMPALIQANVDQNGPNKPGIVMGDMNKFPPGTVVAFTGGSTSRRDPSKEYRVGNYGHVAIKTADGDFNGEHVNVFYHNATRRDHLHGIQAVLVVGSRNEHARRQIEEALDKIRNQLRGKTKEQIRQLIVSHSDQNVQKLLPFLDALNYRKNFPDHILVKSNAGYWGHPPPYGRMAFGVTTQNLNQNNILNS